MRLPRWRFFTWVIVVVNILFLVWVIAGVGGIAEESCEGLSQTECDAAKAIGGTIGAGLILFLWVVADLILGILWLVTNRNRRECPACGNNVKRGQTVCSKCGHGFRTTAQPQTRQGP